MGFRLLSLPPFFPGPGSGCPGARVGRPPWLPGPLLSGAPLSCAPHHRCDLQAVALQRAAQVARGRPGGPATMGKEPGFQVAFGGGGDQGVDHIAGVHAAPVVDVQGGEGKAPGFYGLAGTVWRDASSLITWLPPGTASPSQRDLGLETTQEMFTGNQELNSEVEASPPLSCLSFPICREVGGASLKLPWALIS